MADPNPHLRRDGFADANQARQIANDVQRLAGTEVHVQQRYFIPEEERYVRTESPQERMAARRQVLAARGDPANAERLRSADRAREAGAMTALSGTTTSSQRHFLTEGYSPVVSRDASGRLRIDWSREGDED